MHLRDTFLDRLRAPLLRLPELAKSFENTFNYVAAHSSTQFLPTPIISLPNGSETGTFVVLDLGGSNLRVAVVELLGRSACDEGRREDKILRITQQGNWPIPVPLKSGTAEVLFTWIAQRTAGIVEAYVGTLAEKVRGGVMAEGVPVGIAFSFPMEQVSHTSAVIMPMGKGFTFEITNNLSALLSNAYTSLPNADTLAPLRITAITNDSVATLLSTAYLHPPHTGTRAAAGIIAGTGTNATCLCPVSKLAVGKRRKDAEAILINTEWSINGTLPALAPIRTAWDETLTARSEKPGFQPFEEMVGGRYLGEITRLAAVELFLDRNVEIPQMMKTPYAVGTKLCSEIEGATSVEEARELLGTCFGEQEFWNSDRSREFREIASAVSDRAAALVAAATIGALGINDELSFGKGKLVVGFTGTVLERYFRFRERCQQFLDELAGEGKVQLVEAKDGGIIGAAVLAAMLIAGTT